MKGLIACVLQDMKPGEEDLDGIVEISLTEAPFITMSEENGIVAKYIKVITAFKNVGLAFPAVKDAIPGLLEKCETIPDKIEKASEDAKPEMEAMDFGAKMEAAKQMFKGIKSCKNCAQILKSDLENVK